MEIRKILIVDDEPEILKSVGKILKVKGFEVVTASDGEEGLQRVVSEKPDLIFLDILMPKVYGYEFLERMRCIEEVKETPVIMMTVKSDISDVVKSVSEGGAIDYIIKPDDHTDLLRIIKVDADKVDEFKKIVIVKTVEDKLKKLIKEDDSINF